MKMKENFMKVYKSDVMDIVKILIDKNDFCNKI